MTPKKLAEKIESRSLSAIERLNKTVISVQNKAFGGVVVKLKELDLDSEGYIRQTAGNRAIIREANRAFSSALERGGYIEGLNRFTVVFGVLDEVNAEYFSEFDGFIPNRQFIKAVQRQALADIETSLLNEGLAAQIKNPLSQLLNQNINSGGSFAGMLEQVRTFIKGGDNEGKLLRHVKTIVRDVLFNYSRTYQSAVAADLGMEFYLYTGGIIQTSRPWCRERAGNYYHHREIELWAGESWAGKRPDTTESSIFTYAGGYSCLHQILPVSTFMVPADVIQRATEKGFYTPTRKRNAPSPDRA
jgi:hypothetical protein